MRIDMNSLTMLCSMKMKNYEKYDYQYYDTQWIESWSWCYNILYENVCAHVWYDNWKVELWSWYYDI